MADITLSNEAALHVLDQVAGMLQVAVDAKQALLSAIQADQVRVNLEKTSEALRIEIAALEQDKAQLLADLKNRKQKAEKEIAETARKDQIDQQERQKAAADALAAFQKESKTLKTKMQIQVEDLEKRLDVLQQQIAADEARLAQAQADYAALKGKFSD